MALSSTVKMIFVANIRQRSTCQSPSDTVSARVTEATIKKLKVKVCTYTSRCPVYRTTLHFIPRQTCLFQHQLYFSGKHSAMLHLLYKDNSFKFPPLYTAKYSFIQSELRQCGVNEIAEASKFQQEDLKVGSLD